MDDIEFTPPDTPTQYPSQSSLLASFPAFSADGRQEDDGGGPVNNMGTSPSKDGGEQGGDGGSSGPDGNGVRDGAAPVAPAMPQPDGGVLAALGPPTSSQGSASSSAPKHATRSGEARQEDDLTSKGHENDDDDDTQHIEYNEETEKFAPSEETSKPSEPVPAAAPASPEKADLGESCLSPLTEDQSNADRDKEEDEDDDNNEENEEEDESDSEGEDEIAQDGLYQPPGVDIRTIGGGEESGDDDDDDDEEFGSMPAFETGLLTQGISGDYGGISDSDSTESFHGDDDDDDDGENNDGDGAGEDDDSEAGERSQILLGTTAEGDEVEDIAMEMRQNTATEVGIAPFKSESPVMGTATEEIEALADTEVLAAGLAEGSDATDAQAANSPATANVTSTDPDVMASVGTQGRSASEDEEVDALESAGVVGLTEPTETQQPADGLFSAASGDTANTETETSNNRNIGIEAAVANGGIGGLTEQTERQSQSQTRTLQSTADSQVAAGPTGERMDVDDQADSGVVGHTEQSEVSLAESAGEATEGDAAVRNLCVPTPADEEQTETQTQIMSLLSDSQMMPPPATPFDRSPPKDGSDGQTVGTSQDKILGLTEASEAPTLGSLQITTPAVKKDSIERLDFEENADNALDGSQPTSSGSHGIASPSQNCENDRLADGSEETYDSFRDLHIFSGATELMGSIPSMAELTANSPIKDAQSLMQPVRSFHRGDDHGDIQSSSDKSPSGKNSSRDIAETEIKSRETCDSKDNGNDEINKSSSGQLPLASDSEIPGTGAQKEGEGTDGEGSQSEELLDQYDNADTERFLGGPSKTQSQGMNQDVDTSASTPLISHTQTLVDGTTNSGFSYPRNEVDRMNDDDAEEKKFDSPTPAAAAPSQECREAAKQVESQVGSNIMPKGTEVMGADGKSDASPSNSDVVVASPANGYEAHEVAETATVFPTPTPKKKARSEVLEAAETTTVVNTQTLTGKKTSGAASDFAATGQSTTNKSGLTMSSSPHSQPLLTPSTSKRQDAVSFLKAVEASSTAIAGRGQRNGGHDEIEDSDDEDAPGSGPVPNEGQTSESVVDNCKQLQVATQNHNSAKGGRESPGAEKIQDPIFKTRSPCAAPEDQSRTTIRRPSSPAPAPWIQRTHKSSHRKGRSLAEEGDEKEEEEQAFDVEDDSEPTPQLRMPDFPNPSSASKRKELEIEADDFASSGDDVARPVHTNRRNSDGHAHALRDTQDSLSEVISDKLDVTDRNSELRGSARKRLKNIRRVADKDSGDDKLLVSSSSQAAKKKAKRASSHGYQIQDSLATLGGKGRKAKDTNDDDDDDDDASVSSDESLHNVIGAPSQNTVEINHLMSKTNAALEKLASRKEPAKQIAKLNRKVKRLEKMNSQLESTYEKVRAENAVLKKSLEKKKAQNKKMKTLLSKFTELADRLSGDDAEAVGYGSESSAESRSAPSPPPSKKKAKNSNARKSAGISRDRAQKAPIDRVSESIAAPMVVPPSSVKPNGKSQIKTSSSSSGSGKRKRKSDKKACDGSDDDNVVLSKLKTPNSKTKGKKLDFDRHKGKSDTGRTPAVFNAAARSRSSRRGGSKQEVIPKDMMNVRFEDIWHFLRDDHGWTWRTGPAPYNNVYARSGIEHMNAVGIDVDFFDDGNKLFAEAKRLGFVVKQSQEEDEGESSLGDEDEDGDEDDVGSDDDASSIRSRRGRRGGGFAQKQVDAANTMTHISLSVAEDSNEGEEAVGEIESLEEEEDKEQLASEEEDDDSILDLDDSVLCGAGSAKTLTLQSIHLCARLIGRFAKQSQQSEDASFNNLLWTPLWAQLKDSQGGDEAELKWTYTKSKGQLAQRSYWYVAPQSNGAEGSPGVDYFETEEALVLRVMKEVQQFDPNVLPTSLRETELAAFEAVLTRAVKNSVSYNDSRINPDIGGRRRNRRKTTGENSPFVYSPPNKKAKASKAKPKTSPQKSKKSTSPKRNSKSVTFTNPLPMSQNTLQGVETLLMLNHPSVAVSVATAAAPSEEEKHGDAPRMPTYEDVVTKKGIESLRTARLRQLQDITPSPKKRAAAREAPYSSGQKKQKVDSPFRGNTPSSIDSRLSQVPYQLCENLEDMSQSDVSSSFSRRASTKRGDGGKALPLDGLSFFGSGLDEKHADLIQELGGKYLNDVSSLADTDIFGKLFFVSHVMQRRKLKYILASALGVPMLHYSWLTAIKDKFLAFDDEDTDAVARADFVKQLPYDSKLFKAMRLPVGLSIKSGLYQLQKARHAKRWCRPGYESGMLIFKGLKLTVSLENEKSEAAWEDILKATGATIVTRGLLKEGKKCILDAVLTDRNSLPPHTTAIPSPIAKCLNFVKRGNAKNSDGFTKIPVIDLSWALQCIVERERLSWDVDERYILYSEASSNDKMFEMKIKTKVGKENNVAIRFEVGDIVEFGRTKSIGRILNFDAPKRSCAPCGIHIQLLDRNGNFELIDGGESATRVKIDENELQGHVVMLSSKDFKDIKQDGYIPSNEKDTRIFLQKKPPTAK